MAKVAYLTNDLTAVHWDPGEALFSRGSHATMESSLRTLVCHYLDCYMYSNAVFLCERLVACKPSEENLLLLATCYVREEKYIRAHALLQGCRLPQSRFLLAYLCLLLRKPTEAERALLVGTSILQKGPKECRDEILADPCPIPNGAVGLRLLGQACVSSGRRESAEEYFRLSLELDPLLWVSMQSLCELGAEVDVEKHFTQRDLRKAVVHAEKSACYAAGSRSEAWRTVALASGAGAVAAGEAGGPSAARESRRDGRETVKETMPPPPPRPVVTVHMETPVRSGVGERKDASPVRGGILFGTPTPARNATPTPNRFKTPVAAINTLQMPAFHTPVTPVAPTATPGRNADGIDALGAGLGGRGVSKGGAQTREGRECWPGDSHRPSWLSDVFSADVDGDAEGAGAESGANGGEPRESTGPDKSIGHLLDLATRLGTFFPPAEGPGPVRGPVPGLAHLVEETNSALATTQKEPPAPGYDFFKRCAGQNRAGYPVPTAASGAAPAAALEDVSWGAIEGETARGRHGKTPRRETPGDRSFGAPQAGRQFLFSTPGLTPIPSAQTPDDDAAEGCGRAGVRDTPSLFLTGLLRGSPSTAAFTDALGRDTPGLGNEDGVSTGCGGIEGGARGAAGTIGLSGAGGVRSTRMGMASGDDDEEPEGGPGVIGRPTRSSGGRRVGGRLSFSSAMGSEDGGGVEGGGGGGGGVIATNVGRTRSGGIGTSTEERPSRVPRTNSSRLAGGGSSVTAPITGVPSTGPRKAGAAARVQARGPPAVTLASSGAGTPASATLAGRASRSSTNASSHRGTASPMEVESPGVAAQAGVRGGESVATVSAGATATARRRSAVELSDTTGAGTTVGVADTPGPAGLASGRRPSTRAGVRRAVPTTNDGDAGSRAGQSDVDMLETSGAIRDQGETSGAPDADDHRNGECEEPRLTRAEWECQQWDETLSFAMNFAATSTNNVDMDGISNGGNEDSAAGPSAAVANAGTGPRAAEQQGDREVVLASLAMRKAAQAVHQLNRAKAAAGGVLTGSFSGNQGCSASIADKEGRWRISPMGGGRRGVDVGPREAAEGGREGTVGRVLAGDGGGWGLPQHGIVGDCNSHDGLEEVATLLAVLAKGYQLLTAYRCTEALRELERLSPRQYCTGWVQHQVGRAHFERADYANAKTALESMQRYDPHRLEGLDLLSTTLWHLKREVELSYLAQKVSEFDRHSPYTWCVVGNCFSLQKEHETALRFFQRALQLDSDFVYAYTLCGHEYVANEDFDKAVSCYRTAIQKDRRHYNAWYGLGSIYHRQEKYDMAEYHFRKALKINAQSSVLRVYLGMVLHANKRYMDALDMLESASKSEPTNPQASFQRANVLMSMERYEEALRELEVVRDNVPKESAVYFLMGKVCKKLGRTDAAMRHFTIALDLHNKDKNLIKAAVDRLNEPDLDEEEKF